jgi:hypothetical protein
MAAAEKRAALKKSRTGLRQSSIFRADFESRLDPDKGRLGGTDMMPDFANMSRRSRTMSPLGKSPSSAAVRSCRKYANGKNMNDLTLDFRFRPSLLGGLARARLPNFAEINREAALRRWRR